MLSSARKACLLLFLSCLLALSTAAQVQSGVGQFPDPQTLLPLPDFTDRLVLRPGLVISFPILRGIDTHWKTLGDYQFHTQILKYGPEGMTYEWSMTYPANASGSRRVNPEDLRDSPRVSLFYPKQQSETMVGFTNAIRISDSLYHALKQGQRVAFELDGPEPPAGHHRDPGLIPHSIQPVGLEYAAIHLNNMPAKVRTIRAITDNGWTYWIMDNPAFPMMVQGNGPFAWTDPIFDSSIADAADANAARSAANAGNTGYSGNAGAADDGRSIIRQLEATGEATTHAILFDFDKAVLQNRSKPVLDQLGKYLTSHKEIKLEVQGHTDNKGTAEYNIRLSQRRAQAVKDYLVKHCRIAGTRLLPEGYGFLKPVTSNATDAGRSQNRRVVFKKI